MEAIQNAEFKSKESFKLPAGAEIIKKDFRISIEEIENGFIVRKSYDIQYNNIEGGKDYAYFTKTYYSKENPMTLKIEDKDVPLEDKLD